jgi:hypothetical protein
MKVQGGNLQQNQTYFLYFLSFKYIEVPFHEDSSNPSFNKTNHIMRMMKGNL